MTCDRMQSLLVDHLDRALPPEEAAAVEAHAGECPACRELLADSAAIVTASRAIPAPPFPETAWLLGRDPLVGRAVHAARVRTFALGLATTAILCVGILFTWNARGSRTSAPNGSYAALSPEAIIQAVDYLRAEGDYPFVRSAYRAQ